MSDLPRISLVTPSYNQAAYIAQTIDSVLSQGYPSLDYWVIDGLSTDGSQQVIQRFQRHLSGWVSEKDRGQSDALNKGFARADGRIYAFINSDDLLEPGALREVGERFARGDCAWTASPVRCFGEGFAESIYPAVPETDPTDWLCRCPIPQQGCFWSADLWKRLGGFRADLRYVFDYEYWLRMRFVGDVRPALIDRPLGAFRLHPVSKTVEQGGKFEAEERRVRREYRARLPAGTRLRAMLRERQALADLRQVSALNHIAAGRRSRALGDFAGSIGFWPPMLLSRRTAGLLRRLAFNPAPVP